MSSMTKNGGRRQRRVFGDEFRAGAVCLVLDEGKSAGINGQEAPVWDEPPSLPGAAISDGRSGLSKSQKPIASSKKKIGPP